MSAEQELPVYTKETLVEWADKIDNRLGPITGREADDLARLLRATASRIQQLTTDRDDQDRAMRDAIRETADTADELAFWRYQAIWGRTFLLQPAAIKQPFMEEGPVWKEAIRQLEAARVAENSERISTLIGTPFRHADDCASREGDECTCGAFAADNW